MKERTAIKALKVLHLCAVENFVESQDTTTTKKRERRRHNFMAHLQALLDRERERWNSSGEDGPQDNESAAGYSGTESS